MRELDPLEIPDVADGRGQLDVAHALAADLGAGDLDAAALADLALIADALIVARSNTPSPWSVQRSFRRKGRPVPA